MNTYILRATDPSAYPPQNYRCVVGLGSNDLRILAEEDPTLPGDSLAGGWDHGGNPVTEIDQALYNEIVPLGNHADGSATDVLRGGYVDGWRQEALGDTASADQVMRLYPDAPFAVIVEHYYYEQAEFSGFGFLAEIAGGAASRNPSARAMAVYSDPECTQYLWTGGAYQLGPSRLGQTDENGDPLQVWFSDTPPGQRTQAREDWHLACLFGSTQEGHATLEATRDSIELLFWDRIQGQNPDTSVWVDTGATVIAQAGTLYRISDAEVALSLVPGQQIRFTDAGEITTSTGTWAGGDDYIEIDPFVQAEVGDALWAFVDEAAYLYSARAFDAAGIDMDATTRMSQAEKILLRAELINLGVQAQDIVDCMALAGRVTPKLALLRLIRCLVLDIIRRG